MGGVWSRCWARREFDLTKSFLQTVASEERGHELAKLNLPPETPYRILRFDRDEIWMALRGSRHALL